MSLKMKLIVTGTQPLLMHNPRMVDPEDEINRQIKALAAKRKKTDDDHREIARLEWYGGLYQNQEGRVVQPSSKLRKCIIESARIEKLGKQVERAVHFTTTTLELAHDGPSTVDGLWNSGAFVSRLSVGVGGKRVMRVRPQFKNWSLTAELILFEDMLNVEDLRRCTERGGEIIGIGDNRINGYGRFMVDLKVLR